MLTTRKSETWLSISMDNKFSLKIDYEKAFIGIGFYFEKRSSVFYEKENEDQFDLYQFVINFLIFEIIFTIKKDILNEENKKNFKKKRK